MRPFIVRAQALKDRAYAVAGHDLDHLAITLHVATPSKRRPGFNGCFHFREQQRALQLGIAVAVYFAPWFTLGTQQVTECQASEQPGLAIATRFALDRDPYLTATVGVEAAIDRFDEATLTGEQLQFLADQNALCDRQAFEK